MVSRFQEFYFLRNTTVELDSPYPRCPVTPDFIIGGESYERQGF